MQGRNLIAMSIHFPMVDGNRPRWQLPSIMCSVSSKLQKPFLLFRKVQRQVEWWGHTAWSKFAVQDTLARCPEQHLWLAGSCLCCSFPYEANIVQVLREWRFCCTPLAPSTPWTQSGKTPPRRLFVLLVSITASALSGHLRRAQASPLPKQDRPATLLGQTHFARQCWSECS